CPESIIRWCTSEGIFDPGGYCSDYRFIVCALWRSVGPYTGVSPMSNNSYGLALDPAQVMGVVKNPYFYGAPAVTGIPGPGIGFLIDVTAAKGRIPATAWYANLMVNRGAGYANLAYVDDRAHVTDGTAQIGKDDAVTLKAPTTLQPGNNG